MNTGSAWISQTVFLTSVLTGFSLAVAVQLIAMRENGRIAVCAAAAFVTSTSLLLASTFIGTLMLIRWEFWQQATLTEVGLRRILAARGTMNTLAMIGLVLFLVGLGLAGWLHSKLIGRIAAAVVTLTVLVIFLAIRALP